MKKSTKILLTITSIVSIIVAVVFLFHGMFLMFNIGGYKDIFIEIMINMGVITEPSEVNFQVFMGIFDAVVGVLLNSYAAGVYFKLSKSNSILLGTYKVVLYVAILQCFFIISAIAGILGIFVSLRIKKQESQVVLRPRFGEDKASSLDDLSDRIANLRERKESGKITEEEYNQLLSVIIEDSAKENLAKGQLKLNKVSLKDQIIDLKEKSKSETEVVNEENKDNKKDNE